MQKRTKIVCTMGPATESDDILRGLVEEGMNVARFNFSHGSHEYHWNNIERVRRISEELHRPIAIMLDTKGPEIRTGELVNHAPVMLEAGAGVIVTTNPDVVGTATRFSLDYKNLVNEVGPGDKILIDDGLIALEVVRVEGNDLRCTVLNGGMLGEHKGVNVPGVDVQLPSVTAQDRADIMFGCELGIDAIAASFVRNADSIAEIRSICAEMGMRDIKIFAKIESAVAVANMDDIIAAADGVMVARGDLGVEVAAEQVPHLQKKLVHKCNQAYKPVIIATQMLDSMTHNPRPTRAETADVANAVYDGADCVMLSGETAAGDYPVEAVRTMAAICAETESHMRTRRQYHDRGSIKNVNSAIGYAAVEVAGRVGARCIVCPTHSGRTARLISNLRPTLPIYALSPSDRAIRRTCFCWGVEAFRQTEQGSLSSTLYDALQTAKLEGLVNAGDMVVITAGDPQTTPRTGDYITSTNMLMCAQVQ